MKKILFCILICFALSATAMADCSDGIEITAKNGDKFCQSKISLNWWSAFSWCESQGMHLVKWEEICPGVAVGSTCSNLAGTGDKYVWTARPSGSSNASLVTLSNGTSTSSLRTYNASALCR